MYISWYIYSKKKNEAKNIIEEALVPIRDHIKKKKYVSAKPYWKFHDTYIVDMKLWLYDNSLTSFALFLNSISDYWLESSPNSSYDYGIFANQYSDRCSFLNPMISFIYIDFDPKTEADFFDELHRYIKLAIS